MMTSNASRNQVLELQARVANRLVARLNAVSVEGPIAIAIEMIATRIVGSGKSLEVLRKNAAHDYAFDAASILRNIYDVMLQGLYIMVDPAKREDRAQLFVEFMHVERKRRIELMDASSTDLARRISQSRRRPEAEPEIEKQFKVVEPKYLNKKGKVRETWYRGSLRDLAKAAGYEAEYELMQKFLSGVVHSSPLTLMEGPFVHDPLLMCYWYWRFAFRILGAYADYKAIVLDQSENDLIRHARQNVFNVPQSYASGPVF